MTDNYGWMQLALFMGLLVLLTKPVGSTCSACWTRQAERFSIRR